MPTTGEAKRSNRPVEPQKCASPKLNTPPSAATSQYPLPLGFVTAMPNRPATLSLMLPVEPWKRASPKLNTPPSHAINQYPWPDFVAAIALTGEFSLMLPVEP